MTHKSIKTLFSDAVNHVASEISSYVINPGRDLIRNNTASAGYTYRPGKSAYGYFACYGASAGSIAGIYEYADAGGDQRAGAGTGSA